MEAYDRGLAGVVLSNHGGRQLDFARSGIEVLVEVTKELKARRGLSFPNEKFQLFVDGGVRRATDVIKAIALGATAGAWPPLLPVNMEADEDDQSGLADRSSTLSLRMGTKVLTTR